MSFPTTKKERSLLAREAQEAPWAIGEWGDLIIDLINERDELADALLRMDRQWCYREDERHLALDGLLLDRIKEETGGGAS